MTKLKVVFLLALTMLFCLTASMAGAADKVSLMLDWYPNPDHVPVYVAAAEGYFAKQGLEVEIMTPADPNDPLKLAAVGKIDFAISYQPSVITARAEGLPVISLGSLVQHPLSCILYLQDSGFKSPADFKGRKIGYSVEPLYRVLFEAVAEKAGLARKDYELIRVGFNLTPPLLSGQVDAVIGAFRNYEAIQVELEGKKAGIFPLEEHGIPDFYELVLITNSKKVKEHPEQIKAFLAAMTKAIEKTVNSPEESYQAFLKANADLDDELNKRAFAVTLPFFKGSPAQEASRWEALQKFMLERGLIEKETPVGEMIQAQ